MRKVTRKDINKNNMVTLSYCQCQRVLNLFGGDYKIGYNSGVYGWNYDLYRIGDVDIVTGYRIPYSRSGNKELKKKLVMLDNKLKNLKFGEYQSFKKEFLEIFS